MTDINDELYNYIYKLPKRAAIELLLSAIDEMQSYNGQSQTSAICHAMGAEMLETSEGNRWKLPPITQTKKLFN